MKEMQTGKSFTNLALCVKF